MKKFTLIIFFILFFFNVVRAQYTVIKVIGSVYEGNEKITSHTILENTAKLLYSSLNDRLIVKDKEKGIQIIAPSPKAIKVKNQLSELLLYSIHLNSTSESLSGRGELVEKIPDALQTAPKSNGMVIMEKENKYLFDPLEYPQTNAGTFFAEMDVPNQKPVIRRLKTNNDTLLINYADLITEKMDSTVKYKIGYFNKDAVKKTQLVTSFEPYFDLTNETQDMIAASVLAYQHENITKDAVRDSVYSIVYVNSGKPNGISFTKLFNKYWLSKGQ
jgi:hypothetical protein